jgi:hypothetical protein
MCWQASPFPAAVGPTGQWLLVLTFAMAPLCSAACQDNQT